MKLKEVGFTVRKIVEYISMGCLGYAFVCGLAMMFHIVTDVTCRYLSIPIYGTYEIVCNWYMVAFFFMGLAYIELTRSHISVTMFTSRISKRWSIVYEIFGSVVMFVVFLIFGWYGLLSAIDDYKIGAFREGVIRIITWPTAFYIPIGCWATCAQQLVNIHDDFLKLMRKN